MKDLACWLGEKPTVGPEELFAPLTSFVLALTKAHEDNLSEEQAERRKASAAARAKPREGERVGSGGALVGGGAASRHDESMLQEMQMKQLKRAERATSEAPEKSVESVTEHQQRMLAERRRRPGDGVGDDLVAGVATGEIYRQRRLERQIQPVHQDAVVAQGL